MDDSIVQAIVSSDIIQFKKCFNEAVLDKIHDLVEAEKIKIAQSIMVEGEEPADDEDEDENEDDDE